MEELSKIILAICKHTGYDTFQLMYAKARPYAHARNLLCHIVHKEYPDLIDTLAEMMHISKYDVLKGYASIESRLNKSESLRKEVSDIREELSLERIDQAVINEIPASVRLFGFRWTEQEEMMMRYAMEDSVRYMNKLCRIGRQPIEEGMVFSTKQRKRQPKRTWYNEKENVAYKA